MRAKFTLTNSGRRNFHPVAAAGRWLVDGNNEPFVVRHCKLSKLVPLDQNSAISQSRCVGTNFRSAPLFPPRAHAPRPSALNGPESVSAARKTGRLTLHKPAAENLYCSGSLEIEKSISF